MNIGYLDRRIIIQSATRTADKYGQTVPAWESYATVWAALDTGFFPPQDCTSGRENAQARGTRVTLPPYAALPAPGEPAVVDSVNSTYTGAQKLAFSTHAGSLAGLFFRSTNESKAYV